MKVEDLRKCSFQNWYNDFKKLTVKSIILPLPEVFVSYILQDGIILPKNSQTALNSAHSDDSDDDDSKETWENTEINEPEAPHFPEFDNKIKDAIEKLGGKVFPKLNWSCPQDASWIAFNNCCCCNSVSDIYLLLKSSDFVILDLTQGYGHCDDYVQESESNNATSVQGGNEFVLVLRKWTEIDTSGEFRCFVKDGSLIGICQREHTLYFDHISVCKDEIVEDIILFYHQHIQSTFPLKDYVFDVYRKKKGHVYLIDFSPFDVLTQSLMFSWEELNRGQMSFLQNGLPEFRYVSDNYGVQPSTLSHFALPSDIVDISTGEDSFKLVDLLKLKIDEQNDATSEDEAEWKV